MKQHFLKLRAGPSWCELGSLRIINSLFQFGTEGLRVGLHMLASQWEDTHIHTNTHANVTSLQSCPSWLKRRLPGGRERKEGRGLYKCTLSNSRGAATFGSLITPLRTVGNDLLVLEPSYNVEHQLCMKHFARCFTLWFSIEGRWDGMLEKEVGCLPRLYIVLKNDKWKLKKSLRWDFKETH